MSYRRTWLVTLLLSFATVVIFFATSAGNTAFNHYTLLADSFIHGKLYIEGNMPWLEKIPINENRFFVANPPMPAVVSLLPVLIFGSGLPQQYIAHFIGGVLALLTAFISLNINKNLKLAIWSGLLVGLGSLNWYLATVGSTWYLAHLVSQMFFSGAILLLLKNRNPFWIGLMLGFSYFARIPTILALPFFLINIPRPFLKNAFLLGLGILPAILANFAYNYFRFGVIWDIGYTLIPGVSEEPWYQKGVVHPNYIWEHLRIVFYSLPRYSEVVGLNKPSLMGYAIWFTTPAFIFAIFNKIRQKIVWSAWLSILLISLLIFSHGSTGFSQFGYRFAADFYPLLLLLTIKGVSNMNGPKFYHWILLLLSLLVNFWGVIMLNVIK